MKKILLDTDIGADCDDAVALAVLLKSELDGQCELCGITTSTTRRGASSTINAICNFYGAKKEVAVLSQPALECDSLDNYAFDIMQKYGDTESKTDSVYFLRKKLAEADEKFIFAAIGPLTGIKRLFESQPDDLSPLDGASLFNAKVEKLYCMGGCFDGSKDINGFFNREWNFVQDLDAVRLFLQKCSVPVYFIPKETGEIVFSGDVLRNATNNPVADSIRFFGEKNHGTLAYMQFRRESWDPITCYLAINENSDLFKKQRGNASMDENGVTNFVPDENGNHYVVTLNCTTEKVADVINAFLI